MERESFENEATAKILNNDFVSVKVDREERCACWLRVELSSVSTPTLRRLEAHNAPAQTS